MVMLKKNKIQFFLEFTYHIKNVKKKKIIFNIEQLILNINKIGLLNSLFSLKKFKKATNNYTYDELIKIINKMAADLYFKNVLLFKVEKYQLKLYELTIEQLIVWLYTVNIEAEISKKDKKKKICYLIKKFQKAQHSEKEKLLLEVLHAIQQFIKIKN